MNALIRTELLKQRTLRTFVAGVAAAPLVAALVTIAVLGGAGRQGNDPLGEESLLQVVGAPVSVVTAIALLLGVLAMAGEHRHETITTTFLATPRRRDVVIAKLVAQAITGVLIGLLALAASVAIAIPWLHSSDVAVGLDGDVLRVALGAVASAALYGALGASVGALIRNQTAACAAVLVWLLAVEGLLGDVFDGSAFLRWLPVAAAHAIVRAEPAADSLSVPIALAVLVAYVATLAVAATRITVERDVT
jgi:ABC-2 type transport system permease protein